MGWKPIVSAVKSFPSNTAIQELGTFLLLRASLAPEMESEALEEIALLKTSAETLAESVDTTTRDDGSTLLTADIMTPEGSSLCGEVLTALRDNPSRYDVITELRFKTLALTSHFVAPQEVSLILTVLRGTLADQKTPRCILLSSLFAMQRMYQAAQLHVYSDDIKILLEVLHDKVDDLEVALRVLKVMESFAYTPSAPSSVSQILQGCLFTTGHHVDAHEASLCLVHTYAECCGTLLYEDAGSFVEILSRGMRSEQLNSVEKSSEVLDLILKSPDLVQLLSRGGSDTVCDAISKVSLRWFQYFLRYMDKWCEVECFSEGNIGTLVDSLCQFVIDLLRKDKHNAVTLLRYPKEIPLVTQAVTTLSNWAEAKYIPTLYHPPILLLVEHLFLSHPRLYDRPAIALLLKLPLPQSIPRVHTLLAQCYMREKEYWFPDRALLQKVKARALSVPIDKAMTWSPPKEFQSFVYGKQ
eukprot:TRINITY_DN20937_c0_g1_i1.p1 TRINITY_DN20937_c0_g1~~TRINITY_DN20937_c0_g1_i1.p1  ORF type:complete len:470 (+),score=73.60 TRINITY_DN20937_c0_g1_i1:163-1572(+)